MKQHRTTCLWLLLLACWQLSHAQLAELRAIAALQGHANMVYSLAYSPDG